MGVLLRRRLAQAEALVLAGEVLFVAGPLDSARRERGGFLKAFSATDGKVLLQIALNSTPVYDSLIAADGHLYLTLRSGELLCLAAD